MFAVATLGMAMVPLILYFAIPAVSMPAMPCGSEPTIPNPVALTAGETRLVWENYGGNTQVTVWSNSNATYNLYLLTESQYVAYGNTSGTNGTIPYHPPAPFYWSSGLILSSNDTFALGANDWYLLVYNPGFARSVVNVEAMVC